MVPLDTNGSPGARVDDLDTLGALEYFSTGVASLAAAILCLMVFYQPVVAMSRPLYLLSTTVVLAVFLTTWATLWLALELVWGWRRGRLSMT